MIDFGHGIKLSYVSSEDKDQFFAWRNDPKIWKWCRQNGPISYGQHTSYWYNVDTAEDCKFFSIVNMESTLGASSPRIETVGCAGLTSIDQTNRRAEFSLYIGPEHHRKGYGKRALKTLIDHGFNNLNLHTIWGESFEGNPAMFMFAECGFQKEGIRKDFYFRNGKYIDAHLFSIQREN